MKEKLLFWIAWKMPRSIVYFCAVRVGAYATTHEYSSQVVSELLFIDVLKRWGYK